MHIRLYICICTFINVCGYLYVYVVSTWSVVVVASICFYAHFMPNWHCVGHYFAAILSFSIYIREFNKIIMGRTIWFDLIFCWRVGECDVISRSFSLMHEKLKLSLKNRMFKMQHVGFHCLQWFLSCDTGIMSSNMSTTSGLLEFHHTSHKASLMFTFWPSSHLWDLCLCMYVSLSPIWLIPKALWQALWHSVVRTKKWSSNKNTSLPVPKMHEFVLSWDWTLVLTLISQIDSDT